MPLVLECTDLSGLPIDVIGVSPCQFAGKTLEQVQATPILVGNTPAAVADCFRVTGDVANPHLHFAGPLEKVHYIGAGMTAGKITADSTVGRHVGSRMSGGTIGIDADAGDYVGFEMTGGTIEIRGSAANHVGSCYPGAPWGMNGGTILIHQNAGHHVGYRMRRGTIVIAGDVGEHAAWQMRAGTIIVGGSTAGQPGVDMKRGTIVLGQSNFQIPAGNFLPGNKAASPVLQMLGRWLKNEHGDEIDLCWLWGAFQSWHGDQLHRCKGELFVRA